MATNYILFIHGVNTRDRQYADKLFERLQNNVRGHNLKKISLYWGDVNESEQKNLQAKFQASPLWEKMWFQKFREQQIVQFAGDAALYISRHVGSQVVQELKSQATKALQNIQPDDCIHLVTHSWGTVVLFDILFASRWDEPRLPAHENVMKIREAIYGIKPSPQQGIKIASIHTMGSPIAIFSLTNVVADSTHDITPRLEELLESLSKERKGKKLPWINFVHPGDPIAYPLKELMENLVVGSTNYLDVKDVMTQDRGFVEFFTAQSLLPLLNGGNAHSSYWENNKVVQEISSLLKSYEL